jgi:hypothetical protein
VLLGRGAGALHQQIPVQPGRLGHERGVRARPGVAVVADAIFAVRQKFDPYPINAEHTANHRVAGFW